jgi:hypothetical protein
MFISGMYTVYSITNKRPWSNRSHKELGQRGWILIVGSHVTRRNQGKNKVKIGFNVQYFVSFSSKNQKESRIQET